MTLIKGKDLTAKQRDEVLRAYVHRLIAIGPGKYYFNEQAWIDDHAFYFVKDGSRLALNRRHCEPHYVAEG